MWYLCSRSNDTYSSIHNLDITSRNNLLLPSFLQKRKNNIVQCPHSADKDTRPVKSTLYVNIVNIAKVRKRVRPDCPNTAKRDAFVGVSRPSSREARFCYFFDVLQGMKLALMVQMCISPFSLDKSNCSFGFRFRHRLNMDLHLQSLFALQRKLNFYVFPEQELHGLSPNFHIGTVAAQFLS